MRKPLVINPLKWKHDCSSVMVNLRTREGGIMNRLMLRSLIIGLLLVVSLSVPRIASADSILWDVTATFAGSTTPIDLGTFVFDGTTYSDIHLATSLGGFSGVWA